jgi:hypothetical protein
MYMPVVNPLPLLSATVKFACRPCWHLSSSAERLLPRTRNNAFAQRVAPVGQYSELIRGRGGFG